MLRFLRFDRSWRYLIMGLSASIGYFLKHPRQINMFSVVISLNRVSWQLGHLVIGRFLQVFGMLLQPLLVLVRFQWL